MNNFRNKLINFLYGRNGIDNLGKFSFGLLIVIAIVRIFIRNVLAYKILTIAQLLLLLIMIFRFVSKNLEARRRENQAYERLAIRIKPKIQMLKNRIRDIKYKRYRTCPNCKSVSRLPIKRGKHKVRCPKCRIEYKVFILF